MSLIKFTQIPDRLKYPANIRAKLSSYHLDIIRYVSLHYANRVSFRRQVCQTINTITYKVISGDALPSNWSADDPMSNLPLEDSSVLRYYLDKLGLYIDDAEIEWDVIPEDANNHEKHPDPVIVRAKSAVLSDNATPKEDLYIQPPAVPRFDYTKPFIRGRSGNDILAIYTSLPEIPTKQNEVSVTTDVDKMTPDQLLALFPHQFIRTRSSIMYEKLDGVPFDDQLGILLPVTGFSGSEIRRNVIEYPHIYQLKKIAPEGVISFYQTIEIDGELYPIQDVWDSLEDTSNLPKTNEYIKEYVVRRYLLERDAGVVHKYPLFGSLDRYLTLFTTPSDYRELGIKIDPVDLARCCVKARIAYKQSRNPVIRRLNDG